MTTFRAHFDGKHIVLDEPLPPGVSAGTRLRVAVDEDGSTANGATELFGDLFKMSQPLDLPADYSAQHDHYVKGLPKR
jgi:hypothetical protein